MERTCNIEMGPTARTDARKKRFLGVCMSVSAEQAFGKWRSRLWPVHSYELKKLVPMLLMFFFILFNYTVLRDMKDTLVVTAAGGGHIIPFLKFWGVVPSAIIFMIIYSMLSNRLSKQQLFTVSVVPFLVFFAAFALIIYPNREILHPTQSADALSAILGAKFNGLIDIYRYWTLSLFYVMSELWGSVALSLLFWGFANDTTRISEAKRFYSLFGLGGNFALIISGQLIRYFSARYTGELYYISLNILMALVVGSGVIVLMLYWYLQKKVLTDPRFFATEDVKKKKSKPKLGFIEGLRFLARSKYLGCLAILVMAYGVSINLVEVTWKDQLHHQYPTESQYQAFMGNFSTVTGIMTILMMLFVGGNVMRRFGWGTAAVFTPVVLAITGLGFFGFVIFKSSLAGFVAMLGTTPLFLAVIFGAAQNIFSKSSKYSLFDPTKEMAYIPLDEDSKVKGKAAIDVVGARLGKSGGALLQQFLILSLGFAAMAPWVAVILGVIIFAWILAVRSLSGQFARKQAERMAELDEAAAAKVVEAQPAAG
jgi:ATP:ADP antiporter, AAA family